MPPFGFVPFGFSARECVSVCLVIKDCVLALDSSRGSATEYQEVIRELWALEHALCEVVTLAEGFETTAELNALAGSAKRVADQCKECIQGFLKKVKKYEKSLAISREHIGGIAGSAGTRHQWRDVAGKLGWALFMKDDLAKFRAEINAHSSYINMLLITASISLTRLNDKDLRDRLNENHQGLRHQLESTSRTNDNKSSEQLALLGQLKRTLREQTKRLEAHSNTTRSLAERMCDARIPSSILMLINGRKYFMTLGADLKAFMRRIWTLSFRSYNILLDLQTRVPPEFAQCWIQEPLILTDAIGRVAPVHLELINSWEVLESVLVARFRNIPGGERKIKHNEYALQDRKSLKDLERDLPFEACFMPGGKVDMAMIFQGSQSWGNSCPSCGKGSEHRQSVAVICTGCGVWFQRVEELVEDSFNRPVEVKIHTSIKPRETPPLRQVTDSPSNSWTPSPIQNKRKAENLDPLETMSLFKRVRLMQRPYKDSSRDPTSKSIVTLPAETFVKLQRVFEWVSQSLIYWEDVYDERRQNDFSKSLERQQALHFASFHGDLSAVQDLIDQGVDVNEWASWKRDTDSGKVYEDRFTAIEAAASNGHRHVVKLLLERGANPCLGEIVWGSPLVIAARRHDLELATILMDCGADVNQESVYSYSSGQTMTALQRACCEGDLNMVTLLLSRGAKPNAPGGHYGPALLAATIGENPLLVDRLLEAGADINAVHQIGPKANSGRRQQTALVRAILNNHLSVVRLLLERGADIYVDCECGNAIQNAAFFGREEIIDELIMRGADVYRPSMSFNTVLEAAAAGQQHKLFRRFIAFGMDIYAPCVARINPFYVSPRSSATGSNLLYVAAESGANEIVSFLLDKGMDVNVRGGEYECALIAAVSRGHTITTRLLLEKGANFAILSPSPSHGGTSALYHAVIHGDCDIIQLLLDAGAPINDINGKYGSVLQLAALNTPESVAHLLLDRGIDVNLQGGYFGNALQAWSYVGNHEIVKILLAKGADPLAIGGFYGSAMAAAVHDNHLPVIQLLQEYGAPLPPRSAGSNDFSRSLYTQKSTKVSTKGQVGE